MTRISPAPTELDARQRVRAAILPRGRRGYAVPRVARVSPGCRARQRVWPRTLAKIRAHGRGWVKTGHFAGFAGRARRVELSCVSRALRGGSGKEEPLPKSTTLGAPPLPPRALQAAPGNDGLPPTQPPLGTPRQPMCDGSNPLSHPASGMARHSNPQAGVRTASGSHS